MCGEEAKGCCGEYGVQAASKYASDGANAISHTIDQGIVSLVGIIEGGDILI